jgi:lycopene cyclase domain-containing protein
MTYLNFLIIFLGGPLVVLAALHLLARRAGPRPGTWHSRAAWVAVAGHMLVALLYTTPWDNYLVANGVWTYDPALVLGITFGWVPLEEYLFFLLQPLVAGLWLLWLGQRLRAGADPARPLAWRIWPTAILGAIWLGALALLLSDWAPGTYLALELTWALPPIMLQTAVGGDLLWRNRRVVGAALLSMTLYLSAADALAINSGTWTIAPAYSLNLFVGPLPVEELVFFLLTNTLITFGLTLVATGGARERLVEIFQRLRLPGRALIAGDES